MEKKEDLERVILSIENLSKEIKKIQEINLLSMQKDIHEIRESLILPSFWNKTKIAQYWGYSCQTLIKRWQLPNFGIPDFMNGRSPMYKVSNIKEIANNIQFYKNKWELMTLKEKQDIQKCLEQITKRAQALAC